MKSGLWGLESDSFIYIRKKGLLWHNGRTKKVYLNNKIIAKSKNPRLTHRQLWEYYDERKEKWDEEDHFSHIHGRFRIQLPTTSYIRSNPVVGKIRYRFQHPGFPSGSMEEKRYDYLRRKAEDSIERFIYGKTGLSED